MKFEKFVPETSPGVKSMKSRLIVLRGEGCGLEGCHCSDGYILSVMHEGAGIMVKFDDEREMDAELGLKGVKKCTRRRGK